MGRTKIRSAFPPKLADVEKVLGPARTWAGRCYEIAVALVERGFVEGVPVYGRWTGKIDPLSYFGLDGCARRPFVRHGWVHVRGNRNLVLDPTRWAFTGEDPFIYFGPNAGEYDEGGNEWRKAFRRPCPRFDPEAPCIHAFTQTRISGDAWTHVERMLGPDYHLDLGDDHHPGELTAEQLFWLANAPYDDLQPHARAIYRAIGACGESAAIPVDNQRRAERG